jgi:hypothetical protein
MSICKGCGAALPPSRGPRERKWGDEACRRRGPSVTPVVDAGAVEKAVITRTEARGDPVAKAVAGALARVVDQCGPSTVSAARELRVVLDRMGKGEVSFIDELIAWRAARHAAAGI